MSFVASNIVNSAKRAVNSFATDAFTTSGSSGLYDRARPTYPADAVKKVLSLFDGRPKGRLIEVGAGTGIFTKCLIQHPEAAEAVAKISAVEPSSGMREGFNKNEALHQEPVGVSIVDGSFAELPFPDASADLVIGAQCYHWAHPNYGTTMKEFARVLMPEGTLAFIWNLEDRGTRWVADVRDAYERHEQNTPQYRLGWWRECFETAEYKDNFDPAQEHRFVLAHPITEQGAVDRVLSKSYITCLPKEEQDEVVKRVRGIVSAAEDKVWIDKEKGIFEYPYETMLYTMRKRN